MTPARPFAASVAALGVAGVIAVPAPAFAAPDSCPRWERYAAQSGAELLKIDRLSVRPQGKPGSGRDKDAQPGSGDDTQPHGAPPHDGDDTGGSDDASNGDDARPRNGDDAQPRGGDAGTRPPSRSSKPAAPGAPGSGQNGDARPNGDDQRGAPKDAKPTDRSSSKPADGSLLGKVGGAAGLGGGTQNGDAAGQGGGTGGQGGGTGENLILNGGAATATSPTPELGGSNVGRGYDSFRQPSTGPDPDAREPQEVTVRGLHVGEAKSAMIGLAAPNAAAAVRMINSSDRSRVSTPLVQQAPPNKKARKQTTPAAEAGPILMDVGSLTADAAWRDGMACGRTVGDVTRAAATLGAAQVSGNGDTALVSVPEKSQSVSTTALERTAEGARTVSTASLTARSFELLDGAVQIKVLRTPMLRTTMSTVDGGAVRYRPAAIVVSGEGIRTTKLDAAGDSIEMTFSERRTESARMPELAVRTLGDLPLPTIPGLPLVPGGTTESAPAASPGTSVRISLGKPRQATQGRAVAAKASAITVGIVQGGKTDDGYGRSAELSLDMAIGALESAAVAPEPGGGGYPESGHPESATAGSGGGLPVTGPAIGVMAVIGGTLLASGTIAFLLGRRRRRFEA